MPPDSPTRRRAITIFAAAAAGAMAGGPARSARADYAWRGVAMGADATILFNGIEPEAARAAIAMVEAEIDRLEGALSLYRPDSELCRLNRTGLLLEPSGDLRRAIRIARSISSISDGSFDPTVQPLWETYVDWFTASPGAGLPPDSIIAPARAAVDWRKISLEPDAIRSGPDQRLTLNGLGQGYVTDRVAELLATQGLKYILVDLGEQRALNTAPKRRTLAGRARRRRPIPPHARRARNLGRFGLCARRRRRGAPPLRPTHRPQRRAMEKSNGPSSFSRDRGRAVDRALYRLGRRDQSDTTARDGRHRVGARSRRPRVVLEFASGRWRCA
jgi:hypothetical protein